MKITSHTNGYGRIYCNSSDKQKIIDIIKSIDDFEYEYLPADFICTDKPEIKIDSNNKKYFDIKNKYTYRFYDLDINKLQMRCFIENIPIMCWIASPSYYREENGNDRIYLE